MSSIKKSHQKKLKHMQFLKERKDLATAESIFESQESTPAPEDETPL